MIDGIWYTISRNRMTYNAEGKRTSLENLAGGTHTIHGGSVFHKGEWYMLYHDGNKPGEM